jgi:two-component system, NarL family, nitrate/nitrite response regulator NarL
MVSSAVNKIGNSISRGKQESGLANNNGRSVGILIADGHALFRAALRALLEQEGDFHVVGEAADGAGVPEIVQRLKPDVLLLDLALPPSSGLGVLRNLSDKRLSVRTLLMAVEIDSPQLVEALTLAARGVVLKDTSKELLFKSIRATAGGEYWVGNSAIAHLVNCLRSMHSGADRPFHDGKECELSPREMQMAAAVMGAFTNRQIAKMFAISEETVKNHLASIFSKTGISSRLQLGVWAAKHPQLHSVKAVSTIRKPGGDPDLPPAE